MSDKAKPGAGPEPEMDLVSTPVGTAARTGTRPLSLRQQMGEPSSGT
jgi:hypothetical protein